MYSELVLPHETGSFCLRNALGPGFLCESVNVCVCVYLCFSVCVFA